MILRTSIDRARNSSGRSRRIWLLSALGLFALGAIGMAAMWSQFPSNDPFNVAISNDLAQTVVVAHCAHADDPAAAACNATDEAVELAVGKGFTSVSAVDSRNPFTVRKPDGELIGCLLLEFSQQPETKPTVLTSSAADCGKLVSAE